MVGNTSGEVDFSNRVLDTQKVPVDEDMQYTVFVSYVEIYNNYKRNLLDNPKLDMVTDRQKLASKIPREDRWVGGCLSLLLNNCIITATVYVGTYTLHRVTEVEVKSTTPEEALEAFYRGQKQRSMAATLHYTCSHPGHTPSLT